MCYIKPFHCSKLNKENRDNIDINQLAFVDNIVMNNEIIDELISNEDNSYFHIFEVSVCLLAFYYLVLSDLEYIFSCFGLV